MTAEQTSNDSAAIGQPLALEAIAHAHLGMLQCFAFAVARTHPDPKALLAAFQQELDKAAQHAIPFSELTEFNQDAYNYRAVFTEAMQKAIVDRTGH